MERLYMTSDGSHTLWDSERGQWYHSIHGATDESMRVFIELGFQYVVAQKSKIKLLEMGFGTGLNALLTFVESEKLAVQVEYTSIEAYPIGPNDWSKLNYDEVVKKRLLAQIHELSWEEMHDVSSYFSLRKCQIMLQKYETNDFFDLVYFDAFAPAAQPELWSVDVFLKLASIMVTGGVLTTYCSKSEVRRNLQTAGFKVEKHPGPFRKREVIRAIKV